MQDQELVSVIISTYNEEISHLKEAINSILKQTYKNLEIIIVLDNPKNLEIRNEVIKAKEQDNRIEIIKNSKNLGLVASLNRGIKKCKGKYIVRMDADDVSVDNRIEKQIKYMKQKSLDICGSDIEFIDEDNNPIIKKAVIVTKMEKIKKILKYKNCMNHPTLCINKERLNELNVIAYREIKFVEDYDLICRVVANGGKIENINEKLVKYRIRNNSVSNSNGYIQIVNAKKVSSMFKKKKFDVDVEDDVKESYVYKKYCENKNKIIKRKIIMLADKYLFQEMMDNFFVKLIIKGII